MNKIPMTASGYEKLQNELKHLVNEAFGIFTLINVVTGYVSFINFGFV